MKADVLGLEYAKIVTIRNMGRDSMRVFKWEGEVATRSGWPGLPGIEIVTPKRYVSLNYFNGKKVRLTLKEIA